jgi:hypothetical protein
MDFAENDAVCMNYEMPLIAGDTPVPCAIWPHQRNVPVYDEAAKGETERIGGAEKWNYRVAACL